MNDSLFSPYWYRVSSLRPRLRSHAEIHRHHYRGELWYVLEDHASGRFHRFTPIAHQLIGLFDGQRTVQQVWERLTNRLGDEAPTQDEFIQLLSQLHIANVLSCDVTPDTAELFERRQQQERANLKQRLRSPLAIRIPMWDPDDFLSRWLPLVRPLFGWFGVALWLGVVISGVVLAGLHWGELTENVMDRILTPQNLFLLWLVFPLVKALHELGHGFATKVWGGEVHEMGIMLLVLMPVPYVDASAASAFRDKRRRMVVGAIGILVEMFLAALALILWVDAEPGAIRSMLYNVILLGSVSTLFFNGNPLLRFDGYYVFSDAIEIPNLASRSNRYLFWLVQRGLFGLKGLRSPVMAAGEAPWFVVYSLAAFAYRLFIVFSIALFIAGKFFVVGVILALWAVAGMLGAPMVKGLRYLFFNPVLIGRRMRAVLVSTVLVAIPLAFVLVPIPLVTRAQGVIQAPERSFVRARTDGLVVRLLVESGSEVTAGTPLVETSDPFLAARVQALEASLEELDIRYNAQAFSDRVAAEITAKERAAVAGVLADAHERLGHLVVRSPTTGIFVVPRAVDLPGSYLRQGEHIGYVAVPGESTVLAVVFQDQVGLVRRRTRGVKVKVADRLSDTLDARVLREAPAGTHQLPAAALFRRGGGEVATDPRDPEGRRTLVRVFQFELSLPSGFDSINYGQRVYVRFDHGSEPLAQQWYRQLRQVFLSRLGV